MRKRTIVHADEMDEHIRIPAVSVKPGRKPINGKAMLPAERSRRHRAKAKREKREETENT